MFPYEDLFRYNEEYRGKIIRYRGEVLQVQEEDYGEYTLRIATKETSYGGYFDDIVLVGYIGERLLEGDLVDLYGYSAELITYEAILGNSVTIPGISALYITLFQEELKPVATLGEMWASAKNFDADSEIDGLELSLKPQDINGEIVETEGNANLKLWKLECIETSEYSSYCLKEECTKKDNLLIETWSIPINAENYDYSGFNVQAEYKNYKPKGGNQKGCLEVTFITPDGKNFISIDDGVYLNGF